MLVGFAVLAGGLGKILPQSFLPDEDQGYFIMNVELPEAASLQRTNAVMRKIDAILKQRTGNPLLQRSLRVQPPFADQQQPQRTLLLPAQALRPAQERRSASRTDRR